MNFGKPKQKTLVELVEELKTLVPEQAEQIKYQALKISYNNGLHLDKELYRSELNKYINYYSATINDN